MKPINVLDMTVGHLYAQFEGSNTVDRLSYFKVIQPLDCVEEYPNDERILCECNLVFGMTTNFRHKRITIRHMSRAGRSGKHSFGYDANIFELSEDECYNIIAQTI